MEHRRDGVMTLAHPMSSGEAGAFHLLTPRERQVTDLVAIGASNKAIAARLAITERTVKAHLTNIFQKLGLSNRVQVAIYAVSGGESLSSTKVQ